MPDRCGGFLPGKRTDTTDRLKGADIIQKYGINGFDTCFGGGMAAVIPGQKIQPATPDATGAGWYVRKLYDMGIIGPEKKVDTYPLPMEMYDKGEFAEAFASAISKRIGIGDLLAEGTLRFAEKIGRLSDTAFYNAVTGKSITFLDGLEMGRKAWNLKRAILVLQGRNREMEKFSGFMYKPGASHVNVIGGVPIYDGSKWGWTPGSDMYLDEQGVEQWKTAFYRLEGWDPKTGFPTRKTLEDIGLKNAADALQAKNRLGQA